MEEGFLAADFSVECTSHGPASSSPTRSSSANLPWHEVCEGTVSIEIEQLFVHIQIGGGQRHVWKASFFCKWAAEMAGAAMYLCSCVSWCHVTGLSGMWPPLAACLPSVAHVSLGWVLSAALLRVCVRARARCRSCAARPS